jgi:hypothetical protein
LLDLKVQNAKLSFTTMSIKFINQVHIACYIKHPKIKEQYEECINAYRNTIDRAWGNVQSVLDELTDCDVEQLSNLEQSLHESYEKYSGVSNEFTFARIASSFALAFDLLDEVVDTDFASAFLIILI